MREPPTSPLSRAPRGAGRADHDQVAAVAARLRAAGCVFAEAEAELVVAQAGSADELARLVARRAGGEPLEVVLGWAAFAGLRVGVAPGVFVPRVRTEHLASLAVDAALRTATGGSAAQASPDTRPAPVVVDLCCGSGAIALVVATRVPGAVVHAADIDPRAVACARANLAPVGAHVHLGDLDRALPRALRGAVDVLVANVPYVRRRDIDTLPAEARLHEPLVALDGGVDGLALVRRVAARAGRWLRPGGCTMVETTPDQAPAAAAAFRAHGLEAAVVHNDDLDATAVVARAPAAG